MPLPTKDDLSRIVDLAASVPAEYRASCFELLLKDLLEQKALPATGTTGKGAIEPKKQEAPASAFVLPIDVKAFLSQYKLAEPILWQFFLVEGAEVRPTYTLKAENKARAQRDHALMIALESALDSGQFSVEIEKLRTRCQENSCYDLANFTANIKKTAKLFKSITGDQPFGLAPVLWTVNVPSRNDGTRFGGYSKYHPTL